MDRQTEWRERLKHFYTLRHSRVRLGALQNHNKQQVPNQQKQQHPQKATNSLDFTSQVVKRNCLFESLTPKHFLQPLLNSTTTMDDVSSFLFEILRNAILAMPFR